MIPEVTYEYVLSDNSNEKGIRCLVCHRVSWNPNDVQFKYCGFCHEFHELRVLQKRVEETLHRTEKSLQKTERSLKILKYTGFGISAFGFVLWELDPLFRHFFPAEGFSIFSHFFISFGFTYCLANEFLYRVWIPGPLEKILKHEKTTAI